MTNLPADLPKGKVVGRFVVATVDTAEEQAPYPDGSPFVGAVTFTMHNRQLIRGALLVEPTTIYVDQFTFTFDEDGYLIDAEGNQGAWLPCGVYTLTFDVELGKVKSYDVEILPEHDDATPLDLTGAMPPDAKPAFGWEQAFNEIYLLTSEVRDDAAVAAQDASTAADSAQTSADAAAQSAQDAQTAMQAQFLTQDEGVADLISTAAGPLTQDALDGAVRSRIVPLPYGQQPQPPTPAKVRTIRAETSQIVSPPVTGWVWGDIAQVTFVVPPSGQVIVSLTATARVNSGALSWGLKDSAGEIPGSMASATKSSTPTGVTVRVTVTEDFYGNPLTPGDTLTWTWVHMTADGVSGSTIYGGQSGPAIIEVAPLSDRLIERDLTATVTPATYDPLWLTQDGTLIGGSASTVGFSTDDGATWTAAHEFPTAAVQQVREVSGGELVVFTGWGKFKTEPYRRIGIWRSHGWATDPTTATWTHVHSGTGPDVETAGGNWGHWGVDAFGDVVVANEYGPKSGADVSMARYCYLSEDAGMTWRTIFDLAEMVGPQASLHLHGVCYDPWWDAIWLSNGDGDGRSANWVTFDRGKTWRDLNQGHQMTSVYALPECILWVTDEGDPNGIFRIPRTHPNSLRWEVAHVQDPRPNPDLTVIGTQMFRSATRPGAPLLLSCGSGSATVPGRAFATYDGYTFKEVFVDTESYQNDGVKTLMGPTPTGRYVGMLTRPGGKHQITLELD